MKTQSEHKRRAAKKTQILAYLMAGGTLTNLSGQEIFGTQKVSTRVSELINKDGHTEINRRPIWVTDREGYLVKVTQYSIDPEMRKAV